MEKVAEEGGCKLKGLEEPVDVSSAMD